jgi:hypothetical protein
MVRSPGGESIQSISNNKRHLEVLYEQKPTGPVIIWPRGKPTDKVQPPTEPRIVAWLTAAKCIVKIGFNCYEIVNEKGDALELPFGCRIEDWPVAIAQVTRV